MKPLSLEFTSFGSYPGTQSVDFSSLADLGLYVVTGPTGSGKTTIFDAMAYALYGEVPGARDKGDVRSQHADADATCSVVFRFSVNEIDYRVERTPEQFKPRKRGSGDPVKVAAKAVLVREDTDEAIASQPKKVTTACIELVGLDGQQFERVVLLPQGQFQEFLLANTAVRLPLLRQLFGTGKWLTVVGELQDQAKAAKAIVADIESQLGNRLFAISSSLDNAEKLLSTTDDLDTEQSTGEDENEDALEPSIDSLADRLNRLERRSAPLKDEERRLTTLATEAGKAFSLANSICESWDARIELRSEREQLDSGRADHEKRKAKRDAHVAAEPVLEALKIERRDREEQAKAAEAHEEATRSLMDECVASGIGEIRDPDLAADALLNARNENARQMQSLSQLADADQLLAELIGEKRRLGEERKNGADRIEEINQFLVPRQSDKKDFEALAATELQRKIEADAAAALVDLRKELLEIGPKIEAANAAQREASDRQQAASKAFDDSAAPRLAASLVPGEACAVCGSTEHPRPALTSNEGLVSSAERDKATDELFRAAAALRDLGNRQQQLIEELGEFASRSLEDLSVEREQAGAAHEAARNAANQLKNLAAEIELAENEKNKLDARQIEIDVELAGVGPRIETAEERCEELRKDLGEFAQSLGEDSVAAITALQNISHALARVETSIESCRLAAKALTSAEATAKSSATALADALESSPFATVAEAEAVALDSEMLADLTTAILNYDTRDARNQTLLEQNLKIDLPDQRPDVTELKLLADATQAVAQEATNAFGTLTAHFDQARGNLNEANSIAGGSEDAYDRMKSLESLAKTCDGQGPKRIALETWVLAGELERVAAAANHHLGKMTHGRYQLQRSEITADGRSQSGLDLRVLDAHTGSSRRPGSLSGGEQFQASLALALGLADVIGHGGNANGRVFEALFVDEGFGSLDPDSLDQAVDALAQIQATGRTVGVITHVEAMKESLPIGIRVDRLPNGKGSTLTVRPND